MNLTRPLVQTSAINIIYQDEFILVADKPAGLPTQPTVDLKRPDLFRLLQAEQQKKLGPKSYVGLHHRLDRDTSGLVVFSVSQSVNKNLAEIISQRRIKKTYLASCALYLREDLNEDFCRPEWAIGVSWKLRNHLKKSKGMRMQVTRSGGDLAETDFLIRDLKDEQALIQAMPTTGRMHQIRVHLALSQLPIMGDAFYAPARIRKLAERVMLHAYKLEFPHPKNGQLLSLTAPAPSDFALLWPQIKSNNFS